MSARTFFSSSALHRINCMMSGWSMFMTTILAARRVEPPDAIIPATESAPRMNATGPDERPPADNGSPDERKGERLTPEPEPPLKITPSVLIQSKIESMLSSTARRKHALHWGLSETPTLNHTGELNAARWWSRI